MKQSRIRILTECSILIALASVLSVIKLVDMPYGGSVTPAAMLPILLFAYRHDTKWGLGCATVYAVVQQLLGLENLTYFSSWQSVVGIIVLDYVVAYAAVGLGGIFRRVEKNQSLALFYGAILVCLIRYLCHVIAGAILWAEYDFAFPEGATVIYSISYNATYMLPETIILLVCAVYVASNIDFRAQTPSRMKTQAISGNAAWISPTAGFVALIAVIADTVLIFRNIQDENGNFVIESLASVNWTLVIAIAAIAAIIVAALLAVRGAVKKK